MHADRMNSFVSISREDLKTYVVSNRPSSFDDAENLARLKDAVTKSAPQAPHTSLQPSETLGGNMLSQLQVLLEATKTNTSQQQRIRGLEDEVMSLKASLQQHQKALE